MAYEWWITWCTWLFLYVIKELIGCNTWSCKRKANSVPHLSKFVRIGHVYYRQILARHIMSRRNLTVSWFHSSAKIANKVLLIRETLHLPPKNFKKLWTVQYNYCSLILMNTSTNCSKDLTSGEPAAVIPPRFHRESTQKIPLVFMTWQSNCLNKRDNPAADYKLILCFSHYWVPLCARGARTDVWSASWKEDMNHLMDSWYQHHFSSAPIIGTTFYFAPFLAHCLSAVTSHPNFEKDIKLHLHERNNRSTAPLLPFMISWDIIYTLANRHAYRPIAAIDLDMAGLFIDGNQNHFDLPLLSAEVRGKYYIPSHVSNCLVSNEQN